MALENRFAEMTVRQLLFLPFNKTLLLIGIQTLSNYKAFL
jgi:hypothetical protein